MNSVLEAIVMSSSTQSILVLYTDLESFNAEGEVDVKRKFL